MLWCLSGDLAEFYQDYRWAGWQEEVPKLSGDQAFSIYPPPATEGPPYHERSRAVVPLDELYGLYVGGAS